MESIKHRTQISLDDWQYQTLLDLSRKTKKSLSALIRESPRWVTEASSAATAARALPQRGSSSGISMTGGTYVPSRRRITICVLVPGSDHIRRLPSTQ